MAQQYDEKPREHKTFFVLKRKRKPTYYENFVTHLAEEYNPMIKEYDENARSFVTENSREMRAVGMEHIVESGGAEMTMTIEFQEEGAWLMRKRKVSIQQGFGIKTKKIVGGPQ